MKPLSPKILAIAVRTFVGLVLLIGAGGISAYLVATKPKVDKSELQSQPIRVQVMRVEPVEVARQWRGYGVAQPKQGGARDVPARVGATVTHIPENIEVGRVVKANQIIAELDKTDFNNALTAAQKRIAQADASLAQIDTEEERLTERLALEEQSTELAQADYNRQAERFKIGSATQTDLDRVERTLIAAKGAALITRQSIDLIPSRRAGLQAQQAAATADRDTAQSNLDRTTIKSPIDGIIESLDVDEDENLTPGARVARIVDPRLLEVPLKFPASARSYITESDTVTLTTRSQPEDCPPWDADITRISTVDGPTRTSTVFAEVNQMHVPLRNFVEGGGPYKLPVGAFTIARLDTSEPIERVIVPARAIQEGRIRTVIDGKAVGKDVEVLFDIEGTFPQFGLADTQWRVLKKPLEEGELVILSASMTLLDGQPIDPVITNDKPVEPTNDDASSAQNTEKPTRTDEGSP